LLQIFSDNMEKYWIKIFEQNDCLYLESNGEKNHFSNLLNIINTKYNNGDMSSDFIELLKDDMHVKVFVLKNCIMRICNKQIYDKYYSNIYKIIIKWNHKHLETIYEIYNTDNYVIIISKKITPIFSNYYDHKKTNFNIDDTLLDKLQNQMFDLIEFLSRNNAIHNDLCLDNIGFDFDTNNFVAFDFDKFKIELNAFSEPDELSDKISKNTHSMISYFNKSFNFRFGNT
jgi:hypothetical protein